MAEQTESVTRRGFLVTSGEGIVTAGIAWTMNTGSGRAQATPPADGRTKEEWLDAVMEKKALGGTLHVSRFVERIYFLTKPIAWIPNSDQSNFQRVDVPSGFITDFASVPRPFWSLVPPDGEYTYAAIIHDYLYWTQTRARDISDQIFKFGMQDLRVGDWKIATIYDAVRAFGSAAWNENAKLKTQGEKRFLKKEPDDPTVRWEDWKKRADVFSD